MKAEAKVPCEESGLSDLDWDKIQVLVWTAERTKLGYRLITSSGYIDQSLKDTDVEKCNPVSTPSLQVTEKDLATEEQLPEVLAGLYRRVTGRLLYFAGQRLDAQQALKKLARRKGYPTNIDRERLKRAMRFLVIKQISQHLEVRTDSQRSSRQGAHSHEGQ